MMVDNSGSIDDLDMVFLVVVLDDVKLLPCFIASLVRTDLVTFATDKVAVSKQRVKESKLLTVLALMQRAEELRF